mgnify:CR=1 FL=1
MLRLFLAAMLAVAAVPAQAATYVKMTVSGPASGLYQESDLSVAPFNGWAFGEIIIPLDLPYYCEGLVICGWGGNTFIIYDETTRDYRSISLTFGGPLSGVPTSASGFVTGTIEGHGTVDNRPVIDYMLRPYGWGEITHLSVEILEGTAGPRISVQIKGWVPEPSTWAMMIAGFGLLGGALRRQNAALRPAAV